jgi:enoyl-CoA hydratase/carnithine racemase
MSFDDALAYLSAMLTVELQSEDVVEGVAAFVEKREPNWKGR